MRPWFLFICFCHENQGIGSSGALLRETRLGRQSNNVCVDPSEEAGETEWARNFTKTLVKMALKFKILLSNCWFFQQNQDYQTSTAQNWGPKIGCFSWQSPEEPHKLKVNKNQTSIQSGSLMGLLHGFGLKTGYPKILMHDHHFPQFDVKWLVSFGLGPHRNGMIHNMIQSTSRTTKIN